jgi:hypothetical protein
VLIKSTCSKCESRRNPFTAAAADTKPPTLLIMDKKIFRKNCHRSKSSLRVHAAIIATGATGC